MDITKLHRRAVENFAQKVQQVSADQWDQPTPCSEWDVRALVNHVVGEELWVKPLADGKTIEDVGTAFDGDVLGDDPRETAAASATEAVESFDERVPEGVMVHLSIGDTPIAEYAMQLTADHLVHGWDLAAATGMDRRMDDELVAVVAEWFASQEEMWRSAGAIGPRPAAGGDPQADLLAAFGRNHDWSG
ncbi:TIGR03086 family metal-binding protein [Aeromicrobium sp.]|uniref:TIGR03086 family metal-binding protein n=1 Tax=Aeromicrobium sp. TaxID=1871063 RepID=UPI003D6AD86E